MKKKILSLVILFLIATISVFAQSKTVKFKVFGNCEMCKARIEKAAKSVDGVSEAIWDMGTKMVMLSYDESKVNICNVHKAIAKVGHDTEKYKAEDEVYNKLPDCCKYDRQKMMKMMKKKDSVMHKAKKEKMEKMKKLKSKEMEEEIEEIKKQ